ncbi:hypothetical protein [Staphylococcus shinii]
MFEQLTSSCLLSRSSYINAILMCIIPFEQEQDLTMAQSLA